MDIRIGITSSPRELSFETALSKDEIEQIIGDALGDGKPFFTLTDTKNRSYLLPSQALAYVEYGGDEARRVGFVS